MQGWGLLEALQPLGIEVQDIVLRSYHDGKVLSKANLIPHCRQIYGTPHLDVHRADFHTVLLNAAKSLGIELKLNSPVTHIDFSKMYVYAGEVYSADVILGCDGAKSVCREMILGYSDPLRRNGDLGFRVVLDAKKLREDPALQDLLDPPQINAWFGPHAHVVSYLLAKDDLFNVFLGGPDYDTGEILGPQEVDMSELRERYKDWDPRLRALLDIADKSRKWPMLQTSEIFSWNHPEGKATLLGDAAHGMLPYLGQGAAMAMEDAAVLGTLFAKCQKAAQLPDILTIFEHIRKPRATEVRKRSREMRATHGYPDGPLQQERDRQLALEPFEGWPNAWADPVFQKWLWGYDAFEEAERAWEKYMDGRFPGTRGFWRAG